MATKWYEQTWFVVLVIILFLPAGILLVVLNNRWSSPIKLIWIVVSSAIYFSLYYITTLDEISTSFVR